MNIFYANVNTNASLIAVRSQKRSMKMQSWKVCRTRLPSTVWISGYLSLAENSMADGRVSGFLTFHCPHWGQWRHQNLEKNFQECLQTGWACLEAGSQNLILSMPMGFWGLEASQNLILSIKSGDTRGRKSGSSTVSRNSLVSGHCRSRKLLYFVCFLFQCAVPCIRSTGVCGSYSVK